MNPHLQNILSLLQENENITEEQKIVISKSLKAADKEFEITAFKLDRTEKVKRTTAILLEETIEELEQKRKAVEAQNRELEIEASLERVRTVAMGMQKPGHLLNICEILFKELQALGFSELRNALIHTFDDEQKYFCDYDFSDFTGGCISRIPYSGHPAIDKFIKEIRSANDAFTEIVITGKELEDWKEFRRNNSEADDARLNNISALYYYFYSIGPGDIGISTFQSISDDKRELLKRFRNVFDLAYRRYTDIEKAEAQAREAQIEASLERVRSRTIGMQKSEELRDVIQIVFEQLRHLDFKIDSAHFNLNYKDSDDYNLWSAAPGQPYPVKTYIPYFTHPVFITARQAKDKGLDFFTESYTQEEKNQFFEHLFKYAPGIPEERRRYILSGKGVAASTVLLNTISLWIMNYAGVPYSAAENAILKRFGKIFEQSHTRFLDLQKAEAQAREAQIEAALERVRSRSMAMHKSDELADAAQLLYREFGSLGISTFTCGYMFIDETKQTQTGWFVLPDGSFLPNFIVFPLTGDHVLDTRYKDWKEKKLLHICEIQGEVNKEHHRFLSNYVPPFVKKDIFSKIPDRIIFNCANFSEGYLLILSTEHFSPEEQQTVIRFAKVFEQTYTRFLDLQKAEAQARESQIEAALERVRSRSMAMHKSDELREVVAVLFAQLQHLGFDIKFCTIALIDKITSTVEFWLSGFGEEILPESYHVPNLDHLFYQNFQNTFRQGVPYKVFELAGEEKRSYDKLWFTLTDFKNLPDPVKKPMMEMERVVLSCAFTKNGMIQIGGFEPLSDTDALIIQRFAKVFDQTYTRFLDLKKAEAQALQAEKDLVEIKEARKKAEQALTILKATQTQLIQSEKMASLGELTAGIAHEIQNPLNFVNNFSEVSTELLDEMREELAIGNKQQAMEIANDVKQNLEKILHHGKQADGIVKGMLQHSRSRSAKKEPTDINKLADEYLRLAFHGLRAKDKDFNATLKTDYDETIGDINIIPQDIGRVILNLITNAFYAVAEKKKSSRSKLAEGKEYEPVVTVTTKRLGSLPAGGNGGKIEIKVADNGNGIPEKILDKIFQPFFTTKPTGQGTGLGLSLAYDIVKAHGGELKVETKEAEGTTFIITLPIK